MGWVAGIVMASVVAFAPSARGQEASGYEPLALPDEWREFREKDDTVEKVEYIYRDRSDGLLRIKRVAVAEGETVETVADRETSGSLRFLPDYAFVKKEGFGGGNHTGMLVEFTYTRARKPAMARHYYLKGDATTVWVLQFTGKPDILKPLRNVTDHMARAFKLKG
jgi:hypothetical protein